MKKTNYLKRSVIISRIMGYIGRFEREEIKRGEADTLFILRQILKGLEINYANH